MSYEVFLLHVRSHYTLAELIEFLNLDYEDLLPCLEDHFTWRHNELLEDMGLETENQDNG